MSNPTLLVINFQWSQLIEMKSFIKSTSTMTNNSTMTIFSSRKSSSNIIQPGNHPWSILSSQPATTTRWRSWWVPMPRSRQVEVPSILSAPKKWFLGKLFGKKKTTYWRWFPWENDLYVFFRSNECFKKFIAVSWSSLNSFIFVPKSLMVVYSIHSISQAKIIINFQIKLSPHWVWMAFFWPYGPMFCVAGDPLFISSSTSQMGASLLLAWNCGCSRKIRVRTCENSCSRKDHMAWVFLQWYCSWLGTLQRSGEKSTSMTFIHLEKMTNVFLVFFDSAWFADYSACKVVESEA